MIIKAIRNKKTELSVSLGMILVLLIIASVLMYFLEREAQPESFKNLYSSLWWGVDKYLTATGAEDINPITAGGRFLSGLIAVLGVGMFALPAGIIASGFIEEIENEKLFKRLSSLESKLESAFFVEYLAPVIKVKRILNLSQVPRKWLSINDIKYKLGISEGEVLQVCEFSRKFRINNVKLNGVDSVGLEYINMNRRYGQFINRRANITVINLYPYIQPYFGHFSFAMAEILQANYISNEKFGQYSLIEENRTNLVNNNQYFENSVANSPVIHDIKSDLAAVLPNTDLCIFLVSMANNEYLMQFNTGGEKGSNSFDNTTYFTEKEKLNTYFNKAKTISDKYEMQLGNHATVGKPEDNHVVNLIKKTSKCEVLMLHVNVSILKKANAEYYQFIADFASIFKEDIQSI
jgi:hypothetical protein